MDLVKKISTEIGTETIGTEKIGTKIGTDIIGTKIGTAGKKLELKQKLKRKKRWLMNFLTKVDLRPRVGS